MNLDPKEVKEGLNELLTLPDIATSLGARWIIRNAITLINQMSGDLRRQGFTEYNDKEDHYDA